MRHWHDLTVEWYLRRRAAELRMPAHLGWEAMTAETLTGQTLVEPWSAEESPPLERDIFICHASEDKDLVARPLAVALQAFDYSVWLDESELVVGDSLSESIEHGLAHCRFGVVILSRSFFSKQWTKREIAGLTSREVIDGRRMILPVWHEIDSEFLVKHAPTLADLLAARTSDGLDHVAGQISRAIQKRQA